MNLEDETPFLLYTTSSSPSTNDGIHKKVCPVALPSHRTGSLPPWLQCRAAECPVVSGMPQLCALRQSFAFASNSIQQIKKYLALMIEAWHDASSTQSKKQLP